MSDAERDRLLLRLMMQLADAMKWHLVSSDDPFERELRHEIARIQAAIRREDAGATR